MDKVANKEKISDINTSIVTITPKTKMDAVKSPRSKSLI